MADSSGQADIRGLDIDRLVKGFAEDEMVMRRYVTVSSTNGQSIRWWQKTSGFLQATTPATANIMPLARPFVIDQTYTVNTSYPLIWMHESPFVALEDIKGADVDIWAGIVRDVTRAVLYKEDQHIYNVLTENQTAVNINSNATNAAWNAASYTNVNIVEDLMEAKLNIRTQGYDPEGAILLLSPTDHKSMITWLIDGKGSSIPSFASARIQDGIVMEILGLKVVVSTIVSADSAVVFVPQKAVTLKEFMPITSAVIDEPLIGRKFRVKVESIALLTDPKAVNLITNTQA